MASFQLNVKTKHIALCTCTRSEKWSEDSVRIEGPLQHQFFILYFRMDWQKLGWSGSLSISPALLTFCLHSVPCRFSLMFRLCAVRKGLACLWALQENPHSRTHAVWCILNHVYLQRFSLFWGVDVKPRINFFLHSNVAWAQCSVSVKAECKCITSRPEYEVMHAVNMGCRWPVIMLVL